MSAGLGALNRLLVDRALLSTFLDAGITRDSFFGDELRVFDAIREHQERYGVCPQIATVEAEAGIRFQEFPDEPMGYWIDALERRSHSRILARGAQEIIEQVADGELREAFATCRNMYLDIQSAGTTDKIESLAELSEAVVARHDLAQHSGAMSGIPLGIEYLDKVSDGAQPQDTIAVVGRPGCIAGDTVLYFSRKGKGSGRWYTIEDAYYKFNRISRKGTGGVGHGRSGNQYFWDRRIPTFTQSLIGGITAHNEVIDILYSGKKQLFRVTTESGKTIRVTAEHPFKVMEGTVGADAEGFKQLQALAIGDLVVCKAPPRQAAGRNEVQVERIISIEKDRIEDTYDLVMKSPHNNYVANEFVVHNTGKSYLMLKMALTAKLAGFFPLFVTMEMSPLQCARRVLAMHAGVPASLIRLGRLSCWGRDKLVSTVRWAGEAQENDRQFLLMRGSLTTTVEDVVLRVRELRPHIVFVDGAYLLRTRSKSEARWERVTETAEYLKMVASDFNIPLVASYQFNRRGAGSLGNIAHADAVGQLASIVIGMDDEEQSSTDPMSWGQRSYKLLELLKGREGERGEIRILFDMGRMRIEQDSVVKGYSMHSDDSLDDYVL